MYELFEHTADLGLRVRAASFAELCEEAGRGLFSMMVANLSEVRAVVEKNFHIEGADHEYLLFDWLTELLYTFETEKLLLVDFQVQVDATGLQAVAQGETADPSRHRLEHEVKAITYHALRVEPSADGWFAELIVDI